MARYTDAVSPLTDLAVVYGTEGFQMGFGFVTITLPQVLSAGPCTRQFIVQGSLLLQQDQWYMVPRSSRKDAGEEKMDNSR